MKKGFYFGNYNIFTNAPSEYEYRAITVVQALIIPKHKLLTLLKKYDSIKQSMREYSLKMNIHTNKAMVLRKKIFKNFFLIFLGSHVKKYPRKEEEYKYF